MKKEEIEWLIDKKITEAKADLAKKIEHELLYSGEYAKSIGNPTIIIINAINNWKRNKI